MEELRSRLAEIAAAEVYKIIISKPEKKAAEYRKIVVEKKESYFQAAAYTEKQVFHENIAPEALEEYLFSTVAGMYLQVNAWEDEAEHMLLISKKGKVTYQCKKTAGKASKGDNSHNRKKKYILEEGKVVAPLVDMGFLLPRER